MKWEHAGAQDELVLLNRKERRHQMDMCSTYRVLTGKDDVDPELWFEQAAEHGRNTRQAAHPLNVRPKRGRLEVRAHSFTVRCCDSWNRVPSEIKEKRTAAAFKAAYLAHRGRNRNYLPAEVGVQHLPR